MAHAILLCFLAFVLVETFVLPPHRSLGTAPPKRAIWGGTGAKGWKTRAAAPGDPYGDPYEPEPEAGNHRAANPFAPYETELEDDFDFVEQEIRLADADEPCIVVAVDSTQAQVRMPTHPSVAEKVVGNQPSCLTSSHSCFFSRGYRVYSQFDSTLEHTFTLEESLAEMSELIETAGLKAVHTVTQVRNSQLLAETRGAQ